MATYEARVQLGSASPGNTWVNGMELIIRDATGAEAIDFMSNVIYAGNMLTSDSVMDLVRRLVGETQVIGETQLWHRVRNTPTCRSSSCGTGPAGRARPSYIGEFLVTSMPA